MVLYIIKSNDKYELPLAVYDDLESLSKDVGVKKASILSYISHTKNGTKSFCKYERVVIK